MSAISNKHVQHLSATQTARQLSSLQRKLIGTQAITNNITHIASANQVSRNFVYNQKDKALLGIEKAFTPAPTGVLYHIPVTVEWVKSFALGLALHCKASYRGIQKMLEDLLDYSMSLGSISNLMNETALVAKAHNQAQDLSKVRLGAHDEMYAYGRPILAGIDIPSFYCYLLSQEKSRDTVTWAINLLDLQKQGFNPERVIADDADGLRNAHAMVMGDIPCDYDHFHISKDMMDLRRFLKNRLRTAETEYFEAAVMATDAALDKTKAKYTNQLSALEREFNLLNHISPTINTLISWMEHDVFNMPGSPIKLRRELFNFILQEFEALAKMHPHRIHGLCTKLRNQRDGLLAFVDVLDCKFHEIATKHNCALDVVWRICQLQRCTYYGDTYHQRALPILDEVGEELFEMVEDGVLAALNSTEKTSSAVENLNGRTKSYLHNRKECNQSFLDFICFYLNHTPFRRSARESRVGRSPTEILTGKQHPHWLEILGYSRFKRAAA